MTLMDAQHAKDLLGFMHYKSQNETCKQCKHFVDDDCGGSHDAKPAHCKFNPAFLLPVKPEGRCDFWTAK